MIKSFYFTFFFLKDMWFVLCSFIHKTSIYRVSAMFTIVNHTPWKNVLVENCGFNKTQQEREKEIVTQK